MRAVWERDHDLCESCFHKKRAEMFENLCVEAYRILDFRLQMADILDEEKFLWSKLRTLKLGDK